MDASTDLARLAELSEKVGRNRDAAQYWERAAASRAALLGPAHPEAAALQRGAGELALRGSRRGRAGTLPGGSEVARCLAGRTRRSTRPCCAASDRAACARVHSSAAGADLRRAVDVLRPHQGDYAADYCLALHGLAEWHAAVADLPRAQALLAEARDLAERYATDPAALLADNLLLTSRVHRLRKSPAEAVSFGTRAVDSTRRAYGGASMAAAAALVNLGLAFQAADNLADAEAVLTEAGGLTTRALGEDHPATAASLHALAVLLAHKGEPARAEPMMLKALEVRKKQGETSTAYGESLRDLGDLLLQRGSAERAAGPYRLYLDLCRRQLADLALSQSEQQQIALAKRLREALDRALSLPPRAEDAAELYRHVLAWKGAAFARGEMIRAAHGKPELADLFGQWERLSVQLATYVARVPYPEEQALWYQRVEEMTRERDEAEIELLRPRTAASRRWRPRRTRCARPSPSAPRSSISWSTTAARRRPGIPAAGPPSGAWRPSWCATGNPSAAWSLARSVRFRQRSAAGGRTRKRFLTCTLTARKRGRTATCSGCNRSSRSF